MKQETKVTINWIKRILGEKCVKQDGMYTRITDENYDRSIILLNSIEGLEKNLTKGGIIQDSKGSLCKDGDKINLIVHHIDGREHKEVYTLKWSEKFRHFNLVNKYNIIALEDNDFEKVK